MSALGDYLTSLGGKTRKLGQHDCLTVPADWLLSLGYPDPLEEWRGAYSLEDAEPVLERFAAAMERICLPERQGEPQPGDVGVLSVAGQEAGSIFTGERWAFVASRGIGLAHVDPDSVLAVWSSGGRANG